jgi:two-component system, chemotaxis family, chemotaxis protein CheY
MAAILAIDDSKSLRQAVVFTLERAGYEVVQAEDGYDGLAKALERRFDLILTDYNMPNMDGLALVRELRTHYEYIGVPILVLTTEASEEMRQKGRAAGANGWLVKPFDPERLVEVVRKVIN